MKLLAILAASAIPLACAQGAAAEDDSAETGVGCEIRTARSSDGVDLAGVVTSSASIDGTYELNVEKSGGGGTASSSQSGTFSVGTEGETTLGEVSLGLHGADAAYVAELTIDWGSGRKSCSAES